MKRKGTRIVRWGVRTKTSVKPATQKKGYVPYKEKTNTSIYQGQRRSLTKPRVHVQNSKIWQHTLETLTTTAPYLPGLKLEFPVLQGQGKL